MQTFEPLPESVVMTCHIQQTGKLYRSKKNEFFFSKNSVHSPLDGSDILFHSIKAFLAVYQVMTSFNTAQLAEWLTTGCV